MSAELTAQDLRDLAASWITPELAAAAGLYRVDSATGGEIVGKRLAFGRNYAGIVFPYPERGLLRLRRDEPDAEIRSDGSIKVKAKYLAPPGAWGRSHFYWLRGEVERYRADATMPIVITEGEKKTLALFRLSKHEEAFPFIALGIPGVWNWRGVIGKTENERGLRVDVHGEISDFADYNWQRRKVYLCFDANVATDSSVRTAQRRLANYLTGLGAIVYCVNVPQEAGVNGVDDWLAEAGVKPVLQLFADALPWDEEAAMPRYHRTDMGNAERIIYRHGERLRFDWMSRRWLVWSGTCWRWDDAAALELAKDSARRIYAEAASEPDSEVRKQVANWATRSESTRALRSALDAASSDPAICAKTEDFDADPWLFNTLNCTLRLLPNGDIEPLPHDPANMLTRCVPVRYDPQATAPRWREFLQQVLPQPGLIEWLQKFCGYCLFGDVSEQCALFAYGTGRNGKSTFSAALEHLLGEYGQRASADLLLKRTSDGGVPNDVARLKGARLAIVAEVEEGRRIDEAKLKDLTGGERMTARFMRGEFFDFAPTHKIIMYGNHRPPVRGTDEGIWRRLRLVPFEVQIQPAEVDPHLSEKLREEAPGILLWALEGAFRWRQEGLGIHEAVKSATEGYRGEQDILGRFLEECCTMQDGFRVASSELYGAFRQWAESEGEFSLSQTAFSRRMTERGHHKQHSNTGKVWLGIGLLSR